MHAERTIKISGRGKMTSDYGWNQLNQRHWSVKHKSPNPLAATHYFKTLVSDSICKAVRNNAQHIFITLVLTKTIIEISVSY